MNPINIDSIRIDTAAAFVATFLRIAEDGYSNLEPDRYNSKEDFDSDVANCISEVLNCLAISEPEDNPAEFLGMLYDLLAERGIAQWPEDAGEED